MLETPRRRPFGHLPRAEGNGALPVLASREALFLCSSNDLTVDDDRSRGIVEHRIDTKHYGHGRSPTTLVSAPRPVGSSECWSSDTTRAAGQTEKLRRLRCRCADCSVFECVLPLLVATTTGAPGAVRGLTSRGSLPAAPLRPGRARRR